eukprot:CCRYP_016053-RA/>CCRYP_016053-RA protein AED:0.14 eAED:0.14 QI:280/1/1/1/0/0/2/133/218
MQIAHQANSVRRAFEDVRKRNTVSTATAAVAQEMASMNKKRKSEETPTLPSKASTRHFHSRIAHMTRGDIKGPSISVPTSRPYGFSSGITLNSQAYQIQVTNNDVVCGVGKSINELVGNRRFRVWIDLHSKAFAKSPRIEDRVKIARSVVHTIQSCVPQGRFLSMDPHSGTWYDVGYERAVRITMEVLSHEMMTYPTVSPVKPSGASSKRKTYVSMAA